MVANLLLLAFAIACQVISDMAARNNRNILLAGRAASPRRPNSTSGGGFGGGGSGANEAALAAALDDELPRTKRRAAMILTLTSSLVFVLGCIAYDVYQAHKGSMLDLSMVMAVCDHYIDAPIAALSERGSGDQVLG